MLRVTNIGGPLGHWPTHPPLRASDNGCVRLRRGDPEFTRTAQPQDEPLAGRFAIGITERQRVGGGKRWLPPGGEPLHQTFQITNFVGSSGPGPSAHNS